jgi:Mce-associated membrane protein
MAENKTNGTTGSNGTAMKDSEERPAPDGAAGDAAAEALALAEEAEAEAAEAEALAAAARARARAMRLRRQARSQTSDVPQETGEPEPEGDGTGSKPEGTVATDDEKPAPAADIISSADETAQPGRRWLPRRVRARVALGLACLLILALLAASGYMVWQHRDAAANRHRSAEFAAAARQGVVSLMTLDFNHAKDDVQRVIDNSTGQFRDDFQSRADDFTKVVRDSKVVTKGSVTATAVQSMSADTALVLVAANSEVTNATGAQNEPRAWRLSVTVQRDGPQIKMSRVEFVP